MLIFQKYFNCGKQFWGNNHSNILFWGNKNFKYFISGKQEVIKKNPRWSFKATVATVKYINKKVKKKVGFCYASHLFFSPSCS